MKVFFDSLGCPKALVDAERMCFFIEKEGHVFVSTPEEADAIVINTCGFIEKAKRENIETILLYAALKKKKPSLKLVVSGCLSERYRLKLLETIPEIDSALGVRDFSMITEALKKNKNNKLLDEGDFKDMSFVSERTLNFSGLNYAYLKISEGCDRRCSFCAIPFIRGKQRSRKIEDIMKEAEFLREKGVEELIIVSEDNSLYGTDIYGKRKLNELLKALSSLDFGWIRVMYLFPDEYIYEIASTIVDFKNICRYVDIPLQHVSRKILFSMNRAGGYDEYLEMISKIRKIDSEFSIRTSFIVGYPGEDEEDFKELKSFLAEAKINRVGFFEYSDEEGTETFKLYPKVKKAIVRKRQRELMKIQRNISRENLKNYVGKKLKCVFDGSIHGGKK